MEEIKYTLLDNYTTEELKNIALEIIDCEEFSVYKKDNGKLALKDNTGAYLGNIGEEEFDDLAEIICNLDRYHYDYFETDFVDCVNNCFGEHYCCEDIPKLLMLAEQDMEKFADFEFDVKALELIYHYFEKLNGVGID